MADVSEADLTRASDSDDRTDVVDSDSFQEADPEAPADGEQARARRRFGRGFVSGLVFLLFVAAAAWLAVAIFQWYNPAKDAGTGVDAIAAARTQAINIMTLDYRTAKRDLQRVVDASTGTMRSQYASGESGQITAATGAKSTSTGTVQSAGLSYPNVKNSSAVKSSLTPTTAEVLVIGDATVHFPKTSNAAASTISVHYRFRFEMQKVKGVWKSAQLNFAGLPNSTQVSP